LVSAVQERLSPLADADKAEAMSAYMKGQFVFLGVRTPQRRRATAPLFRQFFRQFANERPLATAQALWVLPAREYQYVAVDWLRRQAGELTVDDLPALEGLVLSKSWWDTVDGLAVIIGALVLREPRLRLRMDQLIVAPQMWLRRVALLHQLASKAQTDRQRLFDYCLRCAPENEFFIRKAIGWALRQYARSDPTAVRQFLAAHRERLSGLSYREASKGLARQLTAAPRL
jgi:3-methyladenine DNA glycosylase AlkD